MAITIPDWVPKFIDQVVAYRERQKVTHERLNELFNLLVVQGDFNTTTLQTLNDNLAAFDLQYLADVGANTTAHQNMLDSFTAAVNQMKSDNTTAIANLDTQQRALLAQILASFEAELTATETRVNAELADTLADIQTLHDEMLAKETQFNADMQTLTNTVNGLRVDILADNQAIATQIQADRLAIENMIALSGQTMSDAQQLYASIDQARTYKKATGTGTAIIATLNSITAYYAGMVVHLIALANNNAVATTLKVDALAALPVYKLGTTTAPNIVAGKPYTFVVSEDLSHFFLVASAEGNAVAEHVLAGDIFSTDVDTGIVGTMTDNSAVADRNLTYNGAQHVIQKGYHNGLHKVTANITNLVPNYIRANVEVGGVLGEFTSDATAVSADILSGKTAYIHGSEATGSMPNRKGETITYPQDTGYTGVATKLTVNVTNEGCYDASSKIVLQDPDFIPANFLATKNVFGLQGSIPVATNLQPASSKQYWLPNQSGNTYARAWMNPAPGYYSNAEWIYTDEPDLLAANLLSGKTVFGVQGNMSPIRISSGNIASVHANISVYLLGGASSGWTDYVVVSGLSFTPKTIILRYLNLSTQYMAVYHENGGAFTNEVDIYTVKTDGSVSVNPYAFRVNVGDIYVNSNGFKLPVMTTGTYAWLAIG